MITAAPQEGPRWMLADWLELEVLTSPTGASIYEINADASIDPDIESDELDAEDILYENRLLRLTAEVEARSRALGPNYPFVMSSSGSHLQRRTNANLQGSIVYLFCLLATHGRSDGFLHESPLLDMTTIPELLQACATWAAAGFVGGPAYAVGYDPTSGSFLQRLATIYAAFGDGVPYRSIPPGAPRQVKDDGVDIIAWRSIPDGVPPADYMMAQVASGRNWRAKTIKADIQKFLNTWFTTVPRRDARPAMIIPYCLDAGLDEDQDTEQEALATRWARWAGEFGQLLYRYVIPHYAQRGFILSAQGIHVDLIDQMPIVETFVTSTITALTHANSPTASGDD